MRGVGINKILGEKPGGRSGKLSGAGWTDRHFAGTKRRRKVNDHQKYSRPFKIHRTDQDQWHFVQRT